VGGELGLVVDRRERVDADGGVDGGQGQRHVAHIRGAGSAPGRGLVERPAQRFGVAAVGGDQVRVGVHLGVGLMAGEHVQGGAGGQGSGLEAAQDLVPHDGEGGDVAPADHVLGFGVGGHHVGGVSAVGDDPVDLVEVVDVLAEQSHAHLGHGEGVEGVDAQLGIGGGVRLLARVTDAELLGRDHRPVGNVERRRVGHHGQVGAGEGAPVQEQDLSAAALLGGGAHHRDGQTDVVGHGGQGQGGPHRGGRDHVVAAGVADLGQGVVLGAHGDMQWTRPGPGGEGGGQLADAHVDGEAPLGQRPGHPGRGPLLLPLDLRMGVDAVGEGDEMVPGPVDHGPGGGLGVHGGPH
jgi:hypothetical protein